MSKDLAFVNCAADDTAPFRLARMLRVGSKNLAASVPPGQCSRRSCGWLGIHEAHLQASGSGGRSNLWLTTVFYEIPCKKYGIH